MEIKRSYPTSGARRFGWTGRIAALAFSAGLAACGQFTSPFGGDAPPPRPAQPAQPTGQTLGTGPVRVALLLPLTRDGQSSDVGQSLRSAAELAIADTGGGAITLLVKDTAGSESGAEAAAQQALQEGAELVIGPLFANNVRAVGRATRASGTPVIAFSTDASAAARRTYLLSFLVENYVDRVVAYAASEGKRSIAVLAPNSSYGNIAVGELQQAAARRNIRIAAIERYQPGAPEEAARRIAGLGRSIDALFIPEQAQAMGAVSSALTGAGVGPSRVLVMGTGLWNDPRALNLPLLQGAVFAAPDNAGYNAFAQRYRARFNTDPIRIATLAYDAVTLAVALAGQPAGSRYSEANLTNSSGFNGADGLFRFRTDGTNQRGLAVQRIENGGARVISPAPTTFAAGSGI